MSFLSTLENWFGRHRADLAHLVIMDASALLHIVDPVVASIDAQLKPAVASHPGGMIAAVAAFLHTYETDAAKCEQVAAQLLALPEADLWREVAVFCVSHLVPAGTLASVINLAIELAYNMLVRAKTTAPPSPVAVTNAPSPAQAPVATPA